MELSDGRLGMRIARAVDDQMVHHYRIKVSNEQTGAEVLNTKLANRFDVVPAALSIDVPLSVHRDGTAYKVELTAVDAQGNASETVSSEIR